MARRKQKSRAFNPDRGSRHANLNAPLPRMSEEELYDKIFELESPTVLVLDCIEDPHNLGACLRTADAAGVLAVVTPKNKAASITETVRRVASGSGHSGSLGTDTRVRRVHVHRNQQRRLPGLRAG